MNGTVVRYGSTGNETPGGADNSTGGTTDTNKGFGWTIRVMPKKIYALLSMAKTIKGVILLDDNETVFTGNDPLTWNTDAVKTLLSVSIGEHTIAALFFINPPICCTDICLDARLPSAYILSTPKQVHINQLALFWTMALK